MNIDCIVEKSFNLTSKERENVTFKKTYKKSKQVALDGICCPRHIHCSPIINKQTSDIESDTISVASQLLKEVTPLEIQTDLWYQFQTKPEIEMIAQINIRTKQYEKMIKQYQTEQLEKKKQVSIQKINNEAKIALQKLSKIAEPPSSKWGHSIFTYNQQNDQVKSKQQKQNEKYSIKQQKKIQLQPISQRIAKYKQQQIKKLKSEQNIQRKLRSETDIQETKAQIKQNAEKILLKMKMEKQQKEEQKKIIQAKIRALQIKSLKKVSISKKKPLEEGLQFQLGDSQYSTFSARAQNRKAQKKVKKQKIKKLPQDPSLIETKKSKYSSKNNSSNSNTNRNKQNVQTVDKSKKQQSQHKQTQLIPEPAQQIKGPFFIWNIPINQEEMLKLQQKSKDVYMNVDRFNYKSGKTFRQEANQFLAKKMEKKMEDNMKNMKEQTFLAEVAKKKEILDKQFAHEMNGIMSEPIWNEEQVFRPNILQNFHFFAKQKAF